MYEISAFYHMDTCTNTFLVIDQAQQDCILIDPVLDFCPQTMTVWSDAIDHILKIIAAKQLKLHAVLETHVHADHFTAASYIKKKHPSITVAISHQVSKVAQSMVAFLNLGHEYQNVEKYFDHLIQPHEQLQYGRLNITALATPGHTPACMSFVMDDQKAAFTGDAIFMPDCGTGRCDFPGGSGQDLYTSITQQLYTLPAETKLYPGHDYPNGKGRPWSFASTVAEQRKHNIQLTQETSESQYTKFRSERDQELSLPRLMIPALQVNLLGGALPTSSEAGLAMLKMPVQWKS
ncbi:MAG: MBL fold metallo-hydrolase [Zetaproteobacteria bacterium]|nr:MBL fold metallo-hydrolase [Zetaproteobacteria bacterium]